VNLILIGYRGCGKSTVGQLLSRRLGWQFVDLDEVVVQNAAGRSIAQIFAAEGEAGFRQRERAALDLLRKGRRQVIAAGGGAVIDAESRALAKKIGKVVWLRAPAAVLWARIRKDPGSARNRPDLTVGGLDEVEAVLRDREDIYRSAAGHIVDTVSASVEEVADAIEMWYRANDSEGG